MKRPRTASTNKPLYEPKNIAKSDYENLKKQKRNNCVIKKSRGSTPDIQYDANQQFDSRKISTTASARASNSRTTGGFQLNVKGDAEDNVSISISKINLNFNDSKPSPKRESPSAQSYQKKELIGVSRYLSAKSSMPQSRKASTKPLAEPLSKNFFLQENIDVDFNMPTTSPAMGQRNTKRFSSNALRGGSKNLTEKLSPDLNVKVGIGIVTSYEFQLKLKEKSELRKKTQEALERAYERQKSKKITFTQLNKNNFLNSSSHIEKPIRLNSSYRPENKDLAFDEFKQKSINFADNLFYSLQKVLASICSSAHFSKSHTSSFAHENRNTNETKNPNNFYVTDKKDPKMDETLFANNMKEFQEGYGKHLKIFVVKALEDLKEIKTSITQIDENSCSETDISHIHFLKSKLETCNMIKKKLRVYVQDFLHQTIEYAKKNTAENYELLSRHT